VKILAKTLKVKFFVCVAVAVLLYGFVPVHTLAASPMFSLYPRSGYALLGKNFSVDMTLDTGGQDLSLARAVIRFNPDEIRVVKAEHGDIFCQYPEDDYTVDNTLGWIKLTGFCLDPLYNSEGSSGLFGRITFVPLVEGSVKLTWVTDYTDSEWNTGLMNDGSPPQEVTIGTSNVSSSGVYTVVSHINEGGSDGSLPGVGIFDNKVILMGLLCIGASLLVMGMHWLWIAMRKRKSSHEGRTVVLTRQES